MKALSTSESHALHFGPKEETNSKAFKSPTNRIAWIRAISEKPNTTFNLTIRDGMGRVKLEKLGLKSSEHKEFGELINLETLVGEDLEVTVDGIEGSENLQLFLN